MGAIRNKIGPKTPAKIAVRCPKKTRNPPVSSARQGEDKGKGRVLLRVILSGVRRTKKSRLLCHSEPLRRRIPVLSFRAEAASPWVPFKIPEDEGEGPITAPRNPVSFRHSERVLLCVILSGVCAAKNPDSSPPCQGEDKAEGPITAKRIKILPLRTPAAELTGSASPPAPRNTARAGSSGRNESAGASESHYIAAAAAASGTPGRSHPSPARPRPRRDG